MSPPSLAAIATICPNPASNPRVNVVAQDEVAQPGGIVIKIVLLVAYTLPDPSTVTAIGPKGETGHAPPIVLTQPELIQPGGISFIV